MAAYISSQCIETTQLVEVDLANATTLATTIVANTEDNTYQFDQVFFDNLIDGSYIWRHYTNSGSVFNGFYVKKFDIPNRKVKVYSNYNNFLSDTPMSVDTYPNVFMVNCTIKVQPEHNKKILYIGKTEPLHLNSFPNEIMMPDIATVENGFTFRTMTLTSSSIEFRIPNEEFVAGTNMFSPLITQGAIIGISGIEYQIYVTCEWRLKKTNGVGEWLYMP